MNPEFMVISYTLAATLKAVGVRQDAYWSYDAQGRLSHDPGLNSGSAAFTMRELILLLGDQFHSLDTAAIGYRAHQVGNDGIGVVAPTPEDALGQLLLLLWENRREEHAEGR